MVAEAVGTNGKLLKGMFNKSIFQKEDQMAKSETHQIEEHKFDKLMGRKLSYRELFKVEFITHFVPLLKIMEEEIGKEKTLEILQKLALQEAKEYADSVVESKGKNDLTVFKENYGPNTPGMCNILTIEILEDTDTVYKIKISECLWAKVFQEADIADYGFAWICSGDVPFARFINPAIDLDLEGTIMEGKPFCKLRYYLKNS